MEIGLEKLNVRLEAARAESKRAVALRVETKRKLDRIGKQLAGLKAELVLLEAEKARLKK